MKTKLFLALALAATGSGLMHAHHFLVASYRTDQTVVVEGKLARFLFRNPHSFLQVEATGPARRAELRLIEWGSAGQLSRAGISKDTLRPGDPVIVTGNPSRNSAERKLRMVSIVRTSDGWRWDSKNR